MSFHVIEHLRDPLTVMKTLSEMLLPDGRLLMHVPVDDQELENGDHFHFFTDRSCVKLMEQVVKDIHSDFVYYPITQNGQAVAATYVGRKIV